MNQGFRSRFEQMRENDPSRTGSPFAATDETERYPSVGSARNVCLVWPDGRRLFLNYAYLIAGEYDPNGEMNQIKLMFSSQTVLVRGYHLDDLFMALLDQLPRLVVAHNPRYRQTEENELGGGTDKPEAMILEMIVENING